jgi:cytochrome c553
MRRVLRWTMWLVVMVLLAAGASIAYVYFATNREMTRVYQVNVPALVIPTDAASIARGKYIAERVSMCTECHSEDLGGKVVEDSFAMGRFVAPNLTRGRGGLGAQYTDQDFIRALLHGVRPDGRTLRFMPSADYHFTEAAISALIAYLKTVPSVDRELPSLSVGPMARALSLFAGFPLTPASKIDHASVAFQAEDDLTDAVSAGAELVSMAGCKGCHGPDLTGGGGPPPGASHTKTVGIGAWTLEDFVTALRTHKRPNGSLISETMPPGYGQMSDVDLHRIFEYLKTVPSNGAKTPSQN